MGDLDFFLLHLRCRHDSLGNNARGMLVVWLLLRTEVDSHTLQVIGFAREEVTDPGVGTCLWSGEVQYAKWDTIGIYCAS